MKYLIFTLFVLHLLACKREQVEINYDGQYITEIKSNVIFLENGQQIVLDMDSVAKVFYLIRHAEKDTTIKDNPPLTESGNLRGIFLADMLRGTRIDGIYSTLYTRTLFTVDSLADIKAMKVLPYENNTVKALLTSIDHNDEIKAVLFVGHSNNIPALTNSLTGKEIFNQIFSEDDYDNFVVVVHYIDGQKTAYPLKFKPK